MTVILKKDDGKIVCLCKVESFRVNVFHFDYIVDFLDGCKMFYPMAHYTFLEAISVG